MGGGGLDPARGVGDEPGAAAPTPLAVMSLAQHLQVHPATVAGRVRHERNNYRLLSQFVGTGQVRRHFEMANESKS